MADGFIGDGFFESGVDNGEAPDPAGIVIKQTVEGLSTANSYADIDDLYAYATSVGYQINAALTSSDIEKALVRAMDKLECYEHKFFGCRPFENQSTALPRTGMYAQFSRTKYIPPLILRVQSAMTVVELIGLQTTGLNAEAGAVLTREKKVVDGLEIEREYVQGTRKIEDDKSKAKTDAEGLLKLFLRLGTVGQKVRLMRS